MAHKHLFRVIDVYFLDVMQTCVAMLECDCGETVWDQGKKIESVIVAEDDQEAEDPDEPKETGKLKTRGRRSSKRMFTTSDEDIKQVRHRLKMLRDRGKLTDNQVLALKETSGMWSNGMSEEQKNQLLEMYNIAQNL